MPVSQVKRAPIAKRRLVAGTERGLQRVMDRLNATAENFGMKINTKKDKGNEGVQKCRRGDKHYDQWKPNRAG